MSEEITNETLHAILVWVEEKVDKTNGRVRVLENWRSFMTGGITIIAMVVGYLIPKIVG